MRPAGDRGDDGSDARVQQEVGALILSGSLDDRTDPMDARALANELNGHGVFAKAVIYPAFGHMLPPAEIMKEEQRFLRTHLVRR